MKKVNGCFPICRLVMAMLVVAAGIAVGCTADTCPTVEVQPGLNDVDPELLRDCEGEEVGVDVGIGGGPAMKSQFVKNDGTAAAPGTVSKPEHHPTIPKPFPKP